MLMREPAQLLVAHGMEKLQLGRVRDKVLGSLRELLRNDTSHRRERGRTILIH